jgi:MoaA/NifB/PqqE/SkfB family radical SAM enzyme
MLTGVHLILTYKCTFECDHCFVYSSPRAQGVMDLVTVRSILKQSRDVGTVEWIYFEGGEPFLFYPTFLEGVRLAREMGFKVGVVSNSYWATSVEDALVALRPLVELGVEDLSVSDDAFHHEGEDESPAQHAVAAASQLGVEASSICIEKPYAEAAPGEGQAQGAPVIGGGAMFKGRAVETLTEGLPRRPWRALDSCPHEDLEFPGRVHVDPYGHVHICQGVSMGNLFETSLAELVANHNAAAHPICGPLVAGGPARLVQEYGVEHEPEMIDECHLCFDARRKLIDRFPGQLAPPQVYGID